jgi:hypothetical protein
VDLNNDGKMDITVTAGFDKKQIAVINNSIISKNEDVLIEDFEVAPNIILFQNKFCIGGKRVWIIEYL